MFPQIIRWIANSIALLEWSPFTSEDSPDKDRVVGLN